MCLVVLGALACARDSQPAAGSLTRALLAVGAGEDDARITQGIAALDLVAARVEARLQAHPVGPVHEALAAVVFDELGFTREVTDHDLRFMQLDRVLADRRGSCYGLSALYLALAERLGGRHGFSAAAVMAPGHLFVRIEDRQGPHNVELLRQGESLPDDWYRQRYLLPAQVAPEYLRPLSRAEVLAVFAFNRGNDLRARGRLAEAAAIYTRAAQDFPQFAEAHASAGLVYHLLGSLADADAAYRAAAAANADLPGLAQNRALLSRERADPHAPVRALQAALKPSGAAP